MLNLAELADLVAQAKKEIQSSNNQDVLKLVRIKFLGKKGYFSQQIARLRNLTPEKQPMLGAMINDAKKEVEQAIIERNNTLTLVAIKERLNNETIDISLPGRRIENGGLHPISRTILRIENFFSQLGFLIESGPEIEDSYHNFDALNIPIHHPSRANQDTFWINTNHLLRTQTSGMQIRIMQTYQPPIRMIASGRVYRNDYDQTHTPMFHQIEGLIIDKNINFTNLKSIIYELLYSFFEEKIKIRFRPSYFPFTEPAAEVDIISKNNCWLEVLGCGMVHPVILKNMNINPNIYSGCAFGIGIERMTMLRYGITDLRVFFDNDLRFLKQFK
ncbi:phenylalanine--tRNA ligase subunit alpha [Candidatus Palibaumannia cicadellinicola]|uniref:Phenylalanine--tRNA ligase alpha subunit n=1 Tax=Candidatus Palibaumannia cicadellinicola TaxID=186490 RepID=A0A0K2BLD4_9GAMM|nr:phenylalanine--tRNA ligase subunit alpha [Candidatus Baumannia cicadellinicola]AKZ66004.1 Phenylalanyl-tRNA synthetase alpha chain [Candidatus Baumannia cicadellinicola]